MTAEPIEQAAGELLTKEAFDSRIVRLMMTEPFWASILRGVEKVISYSIPTAMVCFNKRLKKVEFHWNPLFFQQLTRDQIFGVIKHEAMHIAFGHIGARFLEPQRVFNWAADFAINSQIPLNELPDGLLYPGKGLPELSEETQESLGEEKVKKYKALSDLIKSFPLGESTEWYFTKLMESDLADFIEELWGGGNKDAPTVSDEHADMDDLSDDDKEMAKEVVRQMVDKAVKEADSKQGWGTVSEATRKAIRESLVNVVDWKAVLQNFCGKLRRGSRKTSWQRINKRMPTVASGAKKGYTSSIAVYVDQSGSVGDDALEVVFGALSHLTKRTEFVTFAFDTVVDEKSEATWRRGARNEAIRTQCGGTDFNAPTKHALANRHRFDGYIIITDGEAAKPIASSLKRCYLITPDRNLIFTADNTDSVINMTWPKGK
jgi:predicted metal-dependent peptidase